MLTDSFPTVSFCSVLDINIILALPAITAFFWSSWKGGRVAMRQTAEESFTGRLVGLQI